MDWSFDDIRLHQHAHLLADTWVTVDNEYSFDAGAACWLAELGWRSLMNFFRQPIISHSRFPSRKGDINVVIEMVIKEVRGTSCSYFVKTNGVSNDNGRGVDCGRYVRLLPQMIEKSSLSPHHSCIIRMSWSVAFFFFCGFMVAKA